MYAIDILTDSKKYQNPSEIFDDFYEVASFLKEDLIKLKRKSGIKINQYFDDFYAVAIEKNYQKLTKMKNKLTSEFWHDETLKYRRFQIIQNMMSSEIANEMDENRAGKTLIKYINLHNLEQIKNQKTGDLSQIKNIEIETDLENLDKKTLENGLKKMMEDVIFDDDLIDDIKYLCTKYEIDFEKIIPNYKKEYMKMIKNDEIKKDEKNQMYFCF